MALVGSLASFTDWAGEAALEHWDRLSLAQRGLLALAQDVALQDAATKAKVPSIISGISTLANALNIEIATFAKLVSDISSPWLGLPGAPVLAAARFKITEYALQNKPRVVQYQTEVAKLGAQYYATTGRNIPDARNADRDPPSRCGTLCTLAWVAGIGAVAYYSWPYVKRLFDKGRYKNPPGYARRR